MIPQPGAAYDRANEARAREIIARALNNRRQTDTDLEVKLGQRLIMASPNGARWTIAVSNLGVITATAI